MKMHRFPAACTIISRNYLSYARVLADSFLEHHPGAKFYALVVDGVPQEADSAAAMRMVGPEELRLPYFSSLLFKYDVTELCTAVKPTFLRLLMSRFEEREVLYFDPDILIMRPLEELFACFAASDIVLTPHLLHPIPPDGLHPSERDILLAGAYNLGFLAVRNSPTIRDFLGWWEERLRDGCLVDPEQALMTDQRWIDLVPGLFGAAVLRDETYNVAYWNIHARRLARDADGFRVNSRPLAFFHFSGFNPARPAIFSKHQNRITLESGSALVELLDHYVSRLMQHGFARTSSWKYGYGWFDNALRIPLPARRAYGKLSGIERRRFGDPFHTGPRSFFDWLIQPDAASGISPFVEELIALRPDVAAAFPDFRGSDRQALMDWASATGAVELDYDPRLIRVASDAGQERALPVPIPQSNPRCSIIIPVHNKASLTRRCLDVVLSTIPASTDCEIIVADDASADDTPAVLAAYGDRIHILRHEQNCGFAVSCNDAAALASGEYLIFLNNDTVPQPGWLEALVSYADSHSDAAVVGSRLLFPNDTIQHAGFMICEDFAPRHLYTGFPGDHPAVMKSRRHQAVTGACMLVRRADFERAKGFDTIFHNGYEDVDLCLRLGEMGREVHYCHESVLYHLESVTRCGAISTEEPLNSQIFRRRWAARLRRDEFDYYLDDGLLALERFPLCPIRFSISPLLATTGPAESESAIDRVLQTRSHQVLALLKDNIHLNVRVQEAELRAEFRARNGSTPAAAPRLLASGRARWMSRAATGSVVSIVLPVKNGAAKLRELLPAILGQRTRDLVEIIAVDSASTDESVALLKEADATVISIDPREFNHGLTRNLATNYAAGSIFVFLNQASLPADEFWLANLTGPLYRDPRVAAVCGRVLPREDADLLTTKDIAGNINASTERLIQAIEDPAAYQALSNEKRRAFVNFHTLSCAIRADVFRRIPFRQARFAEDLIWGKEALEAGRRIQFEPSSVVYHSHNYSLIETFRRNFDDGFAGRTIVGRKLADQDVLAGILEQVRSDWRYLERECRLEPAEMEQWRLNSALRRTAQVLGQWLGVNYDGSSEGLLSMLSLMEQIRLGAGTEAAGSWSVMHAGTAG